MKSNTGKRNHLESTEKPTGNPKAVCPNYWIIDKLTCSSSINDSVLLVADLRDLFLVARCLK